MTEAPPERHPTSATVIGLGAIVFWASTVAVSRTATVALGPLTAGALVHLIAGALGLGSLALRGRLGELRRVTGRHLLGCGTFFLLYVVCLHLMVGLAADDRQAVELSIINYLWPGLTLVASVPLLGRQARVWLLPGLLLAFGGVVVAKWPEEGFSLASLVDNAAANPAAYLAAAGCALSWPLYSNLNRRWKDDAGEGAVVWFILAAAVVTGALRFALGETSQWTGRALGEVTYLAVFPTLLAYLCWDIGMRQGNQALVAALAYGTPLLSTAISCLWLGVEPGWQLPTASVLVIAGAVVCKLAIVEPPEEPPLPTPPPTGE
jgi:drug/metabolite transporter (DMT)-like permease